jgi:predicted RecB family nuclease
MSGKITREVLEAHLDCKYKGHLKLAGEQGPPSDYEVMLAETRQEMRAAATERIRARHRGDEVLRGVPLTATVLQQGATVVLDTTLEDDIFSLHFDAIERVEGVSALGDFHYSPVLFCEGEKVRKEQRQLLALCGLVLGDLQGRQAACGVIVHGAGASTTRVNLALGIRGARRALDEIKEAVRSGQVPRLTLNDHCPSCEFRERCRAQAAKDDDLSLLRGMSVQEVRRHNARGIFTVTQLSYTFRVRRKNRRAKCQSTPHSFALQARAIREKKIHVHGTFTIPASPASVFLDVEGVPDRGSFYLVGLVVVEGGVETRHSFWADDDAGQAALFCQMLDELGRHPDYRLYHFGSYEARALRRVRGLLPPERQAQIDQALARAVNVLSIVHPHVYFPTYSCGLKDIATWLGFAWSDPDASGLRSVAWRMLWERSHDESLKARLLRYNIEDCLALKAVVELLARISLPVAAESPGEQVSPEVVRTEGLRQGSYHRHRFGKKDSELPGFDYVNKCAYFDHQRQKVFVRTNPRLKQVRKRRRKARRLTLPVNKVIELPCKRCPSCNSRKLFQIGRITRQIIDLKYFHDGIKRWVTKYQSWHYSCGRCGSIFSHPEFPQVISKYGRGLVSWCIYQNIVGGQNMHRLGKVLAEVFKLPLAPHQLYRFKTAVADSYQAAYAHVLAEILQGPIIHIDETEVDLRGRKGYVWVLTNMERVYFFYRESREGSFLKEMLKGFTGVLVSDFFTAYDALDCPQQKCLIHLLRDLNEDMLKNPFDEEFRTLAQEFSVLLRKIVETIDRHGLKRRHLHKHRAEVEAFFDRACSGEGQSEVALGYRKRFAKYRGKLFTFLDHDGIPWNNANAEHAIKCFAKYRQFADGRFTELSLQDNLIILSVYQSCAYQGVNFLDFLRGKGQDQPVQFGSGRRKVEPAKPEHTSSEQTAPGAEAVTRDPASSPLGPQSM